MGVLEVDNHSFGFLLLLFLLPVICCSEDVVYSTATYYSTSDGLGIPSGACGYGEYGRSVNNGDVAAISPPRLYRGGAGCGACYEIRCKEVECNDDGVKVVVTDHGQGTNASFILSANAFTKMARPNCGINKFMAYGQVLIEYQRVSCHYSVKSLMVKIEEYSQYHYYLAFQFWYQTGISDITAVELFEAETLEWRACRRAYGAVWDISNPPKGDLTARIFLDGSAPVKARWLLAPNVIPAFWQPGVVYDTPLFLD